MESVRNNGLRCLGLVWKEFYDGAGNVELSGRHGRSVDV